MKKVIFSLVAFILGIGVVYAAPSSSISTNRSSIELGQSVTATVTVSNTAAWNVRITGTGATAGCTESFADATANGANATRTFTVTCRSTATGIIAFTATGDITSADGTNRSVSINRTVTVTPVIPRSSNNNLSRLEVANFEISPAFDKNTLEYSVTLPAGTTSINITATREDNTATVTGAGEIEVVEGINRLEIRVVAADGSEKIYVINAEVMELDPITVTVNGRTFTVIRKMESLIKPSTFEETTAVINGEEVPAFFSEITKFTLVGLRDEDGIINLFIFDAQTNTFRPYIELTFKDSILVIIDTDKVPDSRFQESTCLINGIEVKCFIYNENSDFVLIYGINAETGHQGFYVYDKKESTIQRFNDEIINDIEGKIADYLFVIYVLGGAAVVLAILLVIVATKKNKKQKRVKEEQKILEKSKEKDEEKSDEASE